MGFYLLPLVFFFSVYQSEVVDSVYFSSVGFYQMAKIAVTPSIVLAEFLWYRKKVSLLKVTFPFWHLFNYTFMSTLKFVLL